MFADDAQLLYSAFPVQQNTVNAELDEDFKLIDVFERNLRRNP